MKQLSLTGRVALWKKNRLLQKIFGGFSIVVLLTLGLANTVAATPMLDPCNGGDCTVLGLFTGTDSAETISGIVGMSVTEIFKSDPPGLDGSGVTVTVDADMYSGTWSSLSYYIDFVVVKAGNEYLIQDYLNLTGGGLATSGLWSTFGLENNGQQFEISHITFYAKTDGLSAIPEPSTILLLGSGLVGLIGYRWKKSQA